MTEAPRPATPAAIIDPEKRPAVEGLAVEFAADEVIVPLAS